MHFFVGSNHSTIPTGINYPYVKLVRDNWDDYGYKTTYYATLYLSQGETVDLGDVKIIREGQTSGPTPIPAKPFDRLGPAFCSLGSGLDYYKKLLELGLGVYRPYLRGLSDAVIDDEVRERFEDTDGFKVSLLRFRGAERIIADARGLFTQHPDPSREPGNGFLMEIETHVAADASDFRISFDFLHKDALPHRMNAVIGYNGTGKTHLLSNLAIVASGYGYENAKDALDRRAGCFIGPPPPFEKVVVVSYSAFDTFAIPGGTELEKERLRREGDIFGYVYCGLREPEGGKDGSSPRASYRLRSPEELGKEFLKALKRVRAANRSDKLLTALHPLLLDASFRRIGLEQLYADPDDDSLIGSFRKLSSGHKIVLKIVTELTAHLDGSGPTLVLIDEPETHLHPPLLAALLKSIRHCLDLLDGYAIIATHSPVVLQETPSRYVNVLRLVGDSMYVAAPLIETFGESIGVITQEVFNLDDGSTDWHETLRELAEKRSLDDIESLFGQRLGFAARSYVVGVKDNEAEVSDA